MIEGTSDRKRIVVVDDSEDLRVFYTQLLGEDFEVKAFSGGKDASQIIDDDSETVDLLITDLRMDEGHGVDLIQNARKSRPQMPVIVVSAYIDQYSSQLAKSGINLVFSKPFDIARLELGVNTLIYGQENP